MWSICVVCLLLLLCSVKKTVCDFDDESDIIVVTFFNPNYPEGISQFRFSVHESDLEKKLESFCSEYFLSVRVFCILCYLMHFV